MERFTEHHSEHKRQSCCTMVHPWVHLTSAAWCTIKLSEFGAKCNTYLVLRSCSFGGQASSWHTALYVAHAQISVLHCWCNERCLSVTDEKLFMLLGQVEYAVQSWRLECIGKQCSLQDLLSRSTSHVLQELYAKNVVLVMLTNTSKSQRGNTNITAVHWLNTLSNCFTKLSFYC